MPGSRVPDEGTAGPTVRIAGYQGPGSILTRAIQALAQGMQASDADWDLQMEPDVTAGGQSAASLFGSVDIGERQICYIASGYLAARVPSLALLDLPFSVTNRQAALQALDSQTGAQLSADVARQSGYQVLAWWDNGFRHLTNGVRPIRSAADCAGLRIRTLDSALYRETLAALGFQPVTTDVKELVRVVADRSVDAQENPLTNFVNFELWRHHPYVSLSSHFFGVLLLVCHRTWFESLSAAQQMVVRDAAHEATRLQRHLAAQQDAHALALLEQHGALVLLPDALDIASMREATRGIVERQRLAIEPGLLRSYLHRMS
jgi:TRAP-type C4-dicarboxylate transport system substrate-binding protein